MIPLLLLLASSAHATNECAIWLKREMDGRTELSATVGEHEAGRLLYKVLDDTHGIVSLVVVHEAFQFRGVSTELFRGMLERSPLIKTVSGLLTLDNYNATMLRNKSTPASIYECAAEAIKTPFFKAWAKLGFRKIIKCEHNLEFGSINLGLARL